MAAARYHSVETLATSCLVSFRCFILKHCCCFVCTWLQLALHLRASLCYVCACNPMWLCYVCACNPMWLCYVCACNPMWLCYVYMQANVTPMPHTTVLPAFFLCKHEIGWVLLGHWKPGDRHLLLTTKYHTAVKSWGFPAYDLAPSMPHTHTHTHRTVACGNTWRIMCL